MVLIFRDHARIEFGFIIVFLRFSGFCKKSYPMSKENIHSMTTMVLEVVFPSILAFGWVNGLKHVINNCSFLLIIFFYRVATETV